MISTGAIKDQQISDQSTVIKILSRLIKEEMMNDTERARLRYCTKILKQVTKKQLLLNSKK